MPAHYDSGWGWTNYRRTYWVRPDGMRLYFARFVRHTTDERGRHVMEVARIHFWAMRPIPALRSILRTGANPATFDGKDILTGREASTNE